MADARLSSVRQPLVGRDNELDRIHAALDRVMGGDGRVVLVSGEPGIGKTRLVEELVALAAHQGATVACGRVDDADGTPPYWPWVQLLDGVLEAGDRDVVAAALRANAGPLAAIMPSLREIVGDDIPALPALEPAAARFRLHEAIVDVLRRVGEHSRLVLVLDDMHWADVSSLELTRFVATRVDAAPVLLALTYRTVDAGSSDTFDDVLGSLAREPLLDRVALAGLSEAEVGHFMAQMTGLRPRSAAIAAVHARTEGNPFFVRELARLLQSEGQLATADASDHDAVPVGVRDVVRRRLRRLPERTNELLVLGAVLGREFDIGTLAAAAGASDGDIADAIEPALGAGVVTAEGRRGGRLRFSHALIRDTIYAELSPLRRATLHGRVGSALEQRPGPAWSQRSELALHFFHAAPVVGPRRGLTYALEASKAAEAALAYERAEDDLRRALSLIAQLPEGPERAQQELGVQNRLVVLMIITRGYATPEVGQACARARELCRQIGETEGLFKALNNLCGFHHVHGDLSIAAEFAGQLLHIGAQRSSAGWLAVGHLFLGMAQLHTGQLADARASFAAEREAAARLELSIEAANGFFGPHPLPMGLVYSSRCAWVLGEQAAAQAFADEGVRLATPLGHPHTLVFAWYLATHLQVLSGDVPAVIAMSERAIAYCDEHGFTAYQGWFRIFRGWADAQRGRADEAVAAMEPAVAAHLATGARINTPVFLALLADGEAARGNEDGALALVDKALADRGEDQLWESDLLRRRGELLAARGAEHVEGAVHALRAAASTADAQGAVAFRRRADAALAALGLAPAPVTAGASAGFVAGAVAAAASNLSPRERELLGLVGCGLTDKEIAARLVISLTTVRSHLDRIRDKTGRRRRPELTRLAVDLGLTSD